MDYKKPCTRCLLEAAGNTYLSEQVKKGIAALRPEDKVGDEEYKRRLSICLDCDNLNKGTCLKCGCYVELRAAGKKAYCPLPKKKW